MITVLHFVACGLALLQTVVSGTPLPESTAPHYFRRNPITRRNLCVQRVQNELGALLHDGSLIFGPTDPAWQNATERWNTNSMPDVQIVAEVSHEEDVATVVKYCNENSIEFLAYARGHGFTSTITKFKGIEINLSRLRSVTIQPDGKSAWLQGGTYGDSVIGPLWDEGYVAATGSSGCVGFTGVGMGGGLGRYQGQYGLVSDNFINLNVVLADGSTVRVNETSHEDLFWAMRGAGHNFGIVTSIEVKIYPRKGDTWHYHTYMWAQDKLETIFETLNKFQGEGQIPALMGANFGQFSIEPTISETEAVIFWTFAYDGPADEAEELLKDFNAIEALSSDMGDVSYPQLLVAQGTDTDSASCASATYIGCTASLQTYNITAQRQIYNLLNEKVASQPDLGVSGRIFYEGYASAATQAIESDSSAYPHRDEYLIVFFTTVAPEGQESIAHEWAGEVRDLWNAGQPGRRPTTYVNHAAGDESLESIYGYEPWRLEKLRGLKDKYDPHNRFRFYNPIVRDE